MSQSLCEHFQRRVREHGSDVAIRSADGATEISWAQYGAEVELLARGLAGLGARKGDTVGLMLTNRPEFHLLDAAAMHLGAPGFSIYNTSAPDQIRYLVANAEPRVIACESQFLDRLLAATAGSSVETIVCIDGPSDPTGDVINLDDLRSFGASTFDFDSAWRAVGPDDVLTLIYTSGTTGDPKGVELTHANLLYQLDVTPGIVSGLVDGRVLSYLPDAHLINRWVCQYAPMVLGTQVTDVSDPKTLLDTLAATRPTFFVGVPMLWYKIKGRVEATIAAETGVRGQLATWALDAGRDRAAAIVAGRRPSRAQELRFALADRLVLAKVRAKLGMDALGSAVSGAAPIDVAALEFMLALGIPVMEAWGMSETSAVTTVNPLRAPRYGTVGRVIDRTELRLADDGEVLVRGDGVMRGYRKDPERTAGCLDLDGWVHTGDIGTLDADGYLRIVDRKKEMIINSSGKNMSPSNIEGALKAASPLIGSVVAIGDNRPHIAALITLDPEAVASLAASTGLSADDPATLAGHPDVRAAVGRAVEAANARLSRVEHIRSWTILPTYWEPGGDELTPTLKLRRAPISAKYADQIDKLYER